MSTPEPVASSAHWLWARQMSAALIPALTVSLLGLAAASSHAAGAAEVLPPLSAQNRQGPALGQPLSAESLARLPALIYPDGRGLPPGRGLAAQGAMLYATQCASCHGREGQGGSAPELVGGDGPLSSPTADKTLKTYWPYATTLFDTLQRGMPPAAPGRLSADELYALCAWLLAQNGLWPASQPLDATGLAGVRMPNRNGFRVRAGPPPSP